MRRAWENQATAASPLADNAPSQAASTHRLFGTDREQTTNVLGFCGWVVAGGVALFAVWELGNFDEVLGNSPVRPAVQEPAPAGTFRPAGDEGRSGCTQAPIDRDFGHTLPADCQT